MTETTQSTVWLTQEARDKLQAELDHLSGAGRTEISSRIAEAREEGDLRENGGYHAAREEQGRAEARITQLKDILRRAQVGEAPQSTDEVAPGLMITIAYDGDPDDRETFLLGSREVMGLDESVKIAVYSPQSPLGAAIMGKRKGDEAEYLTPAEKKIKVEVVDVQPFGH